MRDDGSSASTDWHGCDLVQFNSNKLSGRATVRDSRMDADSVLLNADRGLTPEEIEDHYGISSDDVRVLLAFAARQRLKATA